MLTAIAWRLRSSLTPDHRTRVRAIVDRALFPVGSINGTTRSLSLVALTFDDGPDPVVTPRVLELLRTRGVHATFFVLTDRAARHPSLVQRIVADGHELALHADRHERLSEVPPLQLIRRLRVARRLLEDISDTHVRFFRPPFGAQSVSTYLAARASGLDVVVWGPYAEDWAEAAPEVVAERGLADLRRGDVLLLHDGLVPPPGEPVPTFDRIRAFELILDGMARRSLTPTTVGGLLGDERPRRTAWFRP